MTYRQKKTFLESYLANARRIKALTYEIERWETLATGITQKLKQDVVSGGAVDSKIENYAIKIVELENQLQLEINAAMQTRDETLYIISKAKNYRYRELLELRYVNGLSVRRIAREMEKTEDNIYKLIRLAIKTLDI